MYSSPVSISSTCTLKAIAYETGYTDSTVSPGMYTIHGACHPDLQPGGGHLWLRTIGDHQYHHRWGDHPLYHRRHTPTETAGTVYSSAVTISATVTLQGHRL